MKNILTAVAVLFLQNCLYASELNLNSNLFADIDTVQIKNVKAELPSPTAAVKTGGKCGHVSGEITQLHLLPQTSKSQLFTYAANKTLFDEFVTMWKPILEKFDLKPAATAYEAGFGTLNYGSAEGLVVRDFLAEKLHYNALDPVEVSKLQHELLEPLERAAMTPIASFNIKNEALRPTFNIYYLTVPDVNPDHEIRLRQLMTGEDIDFDILENAGLQIVKKDTSFSLVYIGKKLGFKARISATEEGIRTKLEEYKKFLKENNMEFINARIIKLQEPFTSGNVTYNYAVNIYFYQ
jgi:hypothetical protein